MWWCASGKSNPSKCNSLWEASEARKSSVSSPTPSSHSLGNNSNEPIIVPWTRGCLGSTCSLHLTCPYQWPLSYHFCLSRYQDPTSFPKVLSRKPPLVWNLFLLSWFPPTIFTLALTSSFNCQCMWATWGQGISFIGLGKFLLRKISVWSQFMSLAKVQPDHCARPGTTMTSGKNFKLLYQEKSFQKINHAKPQVHRVADR